jgi:hypothetical protein
VIDFNREIGVFMIFTHGFRYISQHLDELDRVSLRTATKIADLLLLEPKHWRSMADIGILNNIDQDGVN